jgi:hypothetical protein
MSMKSNGCCGGWSAYYSGPGVKVALAAALLIGVAHAAFAGPIVIVDTLGPNGEYKLDSSYGMSGAGSANGPLYLAIGFVPAEIAIFEGFTIAAGLVSGPNLIDVSLTASGSPFYGPADIPLESFSFVDAMKPEGQPNSFLIAQSTVHTILEGGQLYWLVLKPGDGTIAAWDQTVLEQYGYPYYAQSGSGNLGSWQGGLGAVDLTPAFSVAATAVPDQGSTFFLCALSVSILLATHARQRSGGDALRVVERFRVAVSDGSPLQLKALGVRHFAAPERSPEPGTVPRSKSEANFVGFIEPKLPVLAQ